MSNMNVLGSENSISFLLPMGDDDTLGCHIPRRDVETLIENSKEMLEDEDEFPETTFETETMYIEGMKAGESVMFICTDKISYKKVQFAIPVCVCEELIERLEILKQRTEKIYGMPKQNNLSWKFFDYTKSEAS